MRPSGGRRRCPGVDAGIAGPQVHAKEYENLTYLNVPELVQKKDLLRFWGSLSTRQITNVETCRTRTALPETWKHAVGM